MITKEHEKHSDIARPSYGYFGRNEWAIVGTQGSAIQALADEIITTLSLQYKCAYADAKHASNNDEANLAGRIANGAVAEYTNHINHQQIDYTKTFNQFQYRQAFNDADIVLVNGNHFEAKSQIVIIDESKRTSLKKRLSQLTNVELILLANNEMEVFGFIKEALPSYNQLPVYKLNETDKIIEFFKKKMQQAKPLLNGLVLAGGKSVRMGYDKGLIAWHGKEQQYYLADLLKDLCNEVYISCRPDQQKDTDINYKTLSDTFTNLGPYGAILSAFREQPDVAWLVVACDLPLLDIKTLEYLKDNRNSSSIATAFESPYNGYPEPLITIWEPKSYPSKALRNSDVTVLKCQHAEVLTNVNTQEELKKVQQLLQKKPLSNYAT